MSRTAGEDELAKRRAAQAQTDDEQDGTSIEELEAEGQLDVEPDGQIAMPHTGVTLSTLAPRSTSREHAIIFEKRRLTVPDGGLVKYGEDVLFLVRGVASKVTDSPTLDGEGGVQKVVTEQTIKPKTIVLADSEQAMAMLAGVLEKHGVEAA